MSAALLPCPFCGGEATVGPTATMYIVECNNAGCSANPDSIAVFKHAAIAAWNRRAPVQAQGVALTDAQIIDALDRPGFAWENLNTAEQRNLLDSIRALLAQAQPKSAEDARNAARYRFIRTKIDVRQFMIGNLPLDESIDSRIAAIAALTGSGA